MMSSVVKLNDPALFRRRAFIDGEWRDADDGARFAVHNPASGEAIGDVPRCTAVDTERAIEAAPATPAVGGSSSRRC